jgi:hypothetical protein
VFFEKKGAPIVWAVDIGSIKRKNFAWCRISQKEKVLDIKDGDDISDLAQAIANDLSKGQCVALGFECPLFIPLPQDPLLLTSARNGEFAHPWSAGAGCAALATGLPECAWIFDKVHDLVRIDVRVSVIWGDFFAGEANLFLWEALVTGLAKGSSHREDAKVAAMTFINKYPAIVEADGVEKDNDKPYYSLVGAALLRSHLTQDLAILHQKCIVIKS